MTNHGLDLIGATLLIGAALAIGCTSKKKAPAAPTVATVKHAEKLKNETIAGSSRDRFENVIVYSNNGNVGIYRGGSADNRITDLKVWKATASSPR